VNADQVIERVQLWRRFNYGTFLPGAVVVAEHDWLAYVQAMADAVPEGELLHMPTELDVLWAWPAGVCIVFAEPQQVDHTIVSQDSPERPFVTVPVPAHTESQLVAGMCVCSPQLSRTQLPDGTPMDDVQAYPLLWIGTEPGDIISGHWLPGSAMHVSATGVLSHSSRLQLAIVTALGHRLTRYDAITGTRPERRRAERELPGLRVLQLSTGASVRSEALPTRSGREWSRRWMVRGHWHTVAYGPRKSLRRPQWYDPYVKGPEDKPLDVRPTLWRATQGGAS